MCQHKVLAAFLSEIHTLYRDEKKLLEYAVTYGSKGEGAKWAMHEQDLICTLFITPNSIK